MSYTRRKFLTHTGTLLAAGGAVTTSVPAFANHTNRTATGSLSTAKENSVNVLDYGARGDGEHDDTEAFRHAFAAANSNGHAVFVPRTSEYYLVGNVELPEGVTLFSDSRKRIYRPNSVDDMRGSSAIVFNQSDSRGISFSGSSLVSNLNFYGVDRSYDGVSDKHEVTGMVFIDCSMIEHHWGWGADYSICNSRFVRCHATMNNAGVGGLVDSKFLQGEINDNQGNGIYLRKGHNANNFVDCQVVRNTKANYKFVGSGNNTIVGGMSDNAGEQGLLVEDAELLTTGFTLYRSGRISSGTNRSAHVSVSGASRLVMNGSRFRTGSDSSYNNIRPAYLFANDKGEEVTHVFQVIGGDATDSFIRDVFDDESLFKNSKIQIVNVAGLDDVVTFGANKTSRGTTYIAKDQQYLSRAQTMFVDVIDAPVIEPDQVNQPLKVKLNLIDDNGETHAAELIFLAVTGYSSSVYIRSNTLYETKEGLVDNLNPYIDNVNEYGTEFTLNLTNSLGNQIDCSALVCEA
ncbi:hypothetical protein L0B53_04300 [Vibrio sp. SS-MA-C1-2]|uniref:glycosyl hydrolase family 28-related protein n=1 Tax=Vibrio sp. SS-MA-C1-2 TaxID=2908646 RepID=UPI001F317076|nr:glycosyl hydrolase family 28-related protein [Vibrio sp. SS-MA-C1-2]UJF17144.1 hypothetical protein L0B53_04300 [Vibrio sp. SS-MA-C1-2]